MNLNTAQTVQFTIRTGICSRLTDPRRISTAKVDNSRFKQQFGFKAKMLPAEQAEPLIGHAVGGVCPFALNPGVAVYLDDSLKRFATVYPAAGSSNSAVRLSLPELEKLSQSLSWVNVCKAWREDEQ